MADVIISKLGKRIQTLQGGFKTRIIDARARNKSRNNVVLNRRIETDRVAANPVPPPQFLQNPTVDVNLFQKYSDRMDNVNLLLLAREPNVTRFYNTDDYTKNMPNGVTFASLEALSNERLFFVFFVILIGCDRAHDFNKYHIKYVFNSKAKTFLDNPKKFKTTAKNLSWLNLISIKGKNIEDLFRVSQIGLKNHIMEACDVDNDGTDTIIAHCIFLIHCEIYRECNKILYTPKPNSSLKKYCKDSLGAFYNSDSAAKTVSEAITRILGIASYPAVDVLGQSCDNSVVIANTLYPSGILVPDEIVRIRIDATGLGLNSANDLAQLKGSMARYKDLSTKNRQALILDSVSAYDRAQAGNLEKTFKTVKQVDERYITQRIQAYVEIDGTRKYILDAIVTPDPAWTPGEPPPKITLDVYNFLNENINTQFSSEDGGNSLSRVIGKIVEVWVIEHGNVPIPMTSSMGDKVGKKIQILSAQKTLGDLMQLILYADSPSPKVFHTFDEICSAIGGVLGKTSVRDEGTALTETFRRIYFPIVKGQTLKLSYLKTCNISLSSFGKNKNKDISKRLKFKSNLELKNKLKSVGIKITKTIRGKRKYLSRKELENKAKLFNKIQNTARRIKIKIMYKKNGMYKHKTYKRLQKEIKKMKNKKNKQVVKRSGFG